MTRRLWTDSSGTEILVLLRSEQRQFVCVVVVVDKLAPVEMLGKVLGPVSLGNALALTLLAELEHHVGQLSDGFLAGLAFAVYDIQSRPLV